MTMSQWKRNNRTPKRGLHNKNREQLWWLVFWGDDTMGTMGKSWSQRAFQRFSSEPGWWPAITAIPGGNATYPQHTGREESAPANQAAPQPSPAQPYISLSQPPVVPAAFAVASGHLVRRAPHPSAQTASAFLSSPREPTLKTVPPGQMPAREATPVKPAPPPAAAPSSPPVVDFGSRGAAPLGERTWLPTQELLSTRVAEKNGNVSNNLARETQSPLGGEGFSVVGLGNHVKFHMVQVVITLRPETTQVARCWSTRFTRATISIRGPSGLSGGGVGDLRRTPLTKKGFLVKLVY